MRRRRFRSRRSGLSVPKRWAGDLSPAETAVAATTLEGQAIVIPSDYAQGAMEQGGVTLVRIRGQLSLRNNAAVPNVLSAAIYVAHEGLPTQDPATFAGFIDGEVLWHWTGVLTSTGIGASPQEIVDLDIKSGRKLRDDQVVLALFATQAFAYAYGLRCLMLGG